MVPAGSAVEQLAVESGIGDMIEALRYLHKLMFLSYLMPETAIEVVGTGTGDSNLAKSQLGLLGQSVQSMVDQINEQIIEKVIRPLIFWNHGEQDEYGEFPNPQTEEVDKLAWFQAILSGFTQGFFGFDDLEATNFARELAGLPPLEEGEQPAQGEDAFTGFGKEETDEDEELTGFRSLAKAVDYFAQQWQERDEVAELLLALINQSYGTADKIESWELDDDVFTGVFSDRITRTTTARFEFMAAPEGLTYTPLNPEVSERFGIETFAPKGKGKRKCNPARSFKCGNSCQSWLTKAGKPKKCRANANLTAAQQAAYQKGLNAALAAAGQPTTSPAAQPAGSSAGAPAGAKPNASDDFRDLEDAIANEQWDLALDAAENIDTRALSLSFDAGGQDAVLTQLWKEAGFDGKPEIISAQDFADAWNNGEMQFYRNPSTSSFQTRFSNWKDGDHSAGGGIYGNGIYAARAQKGDQFGATSRTRARGAADAYGSGQFRGVIKSGANIANQSDVVKAQKKSLASFDNWASQFDGTKTPGTPTQVKKHRNQFSNYDTRSGKTDPFTDRSRTVIINKNDKTDEIQIGTTKQRSTAAGNARGWGAQLSDGTWVRPAKNQANTHGNFKSRRAAATALREAWHINETSTIKNADTTKQRKAAIARDVIFGDGKPGPVSPAGLGSPSTGMSGRYATLKGHQAVRLNEAYNNTYTLILDRGATQTIDKRFRNGAKI